MKKLKIKYNEIWKPLLLDRNDTNYIISNKGRIYNNVTKTMLKPAISTKGYEKVTIFLNGKRHYKLIHRLVAETFVINEYSKKEVNHRNGNKTSNYSMNLEWNTRMENQQHAIRTGLRDECIPSGENNYKSMYTNAQIRGICQMIEDGYTNKYIEENCGLHTYKNFVSHIRLRNKWTKVSKDYNW